MSNENIHSETRYDDLNGEISVNFDKQVDLNTFASKLAGIDTSKYQPLAVRAYITHAAIVTFYTMDIEHSKNYVGPTGKVPVTKFKVEVHPAELFKMFRQIDFTLIASDYSVDQFDVIN